MEGQTGDKNPICLSEITDKLENVPVSQMIVLDNGQTGKCPCEIAQPCVFRALGTNWRNLGTNRGTEFSLYSEREFRKCP